MTIDSQTSPLRESSRARLVTKLRSRGLHRLTSAIAQGLAGDLGEPSIARWRLRSATRTECRIAVVFVGAPGAAHPSAVIRLAPSNEGAAVLEREATSLEALHADPRVGTWSRNAPRMLGTGTLDGWTYAAQEALTGVATTGSFRDATERPRSLSEAAQLIGDLHQRTATASTIDDARLEGWVDRRIRPLIPLVGDAEALARVRTELRTVLQERAVVPTGWIHGDLWPGNVLASRERGLTGIVDWDRAATDELAFHDVLHLLVSTRRLVAGGELGHVLCGLLSGAAPWTQSERAILAPLPFPQNEDEGRAALTLYWLRHLESNLVQSQSYARHRRWIRENVRAVLDCS